MNKIREMQNLLAKIPKGRVSTYKILANKMGTRPRAAGKLLGCNTDAVKYPCYKIILSSGRIGGYSGKGGVKRKIQLLKRDRIIIKDGRIDIRKYVFEF
jgi:methylated-DNA-[protein]-cysteine S-methyltransferase